MDGRYKNKALIGTIVGISLFAGGWVLMSTLDRGSSHSRASALKLIPIAMMLVSIPLYLWGCAALAKAKGYSTAIVLTCVLGGLFPLVVLLALPDKNKRHRKWR